MLNMPSALAGINGAAVASISPALDPEDEEYCWFETIRPDFAQGNASVLAGAAKLIEAKKALKKHKGSFVRLVERLGQDLDKIERLMKIARHPVLSDSAHARNLPLSWMTLYTLAALPPKTLEDFIKDGTIHPELERKEAERLVRKVRGSNSNRNQDHVEDHDEGRGAHDADPGDNHADHGVDRAPEESAPTTAAAQPAGRDTAGPNSQSELDRKLARLEELEREVRHHEIQRIGFESEIGELKAKLGAETAVRSQRKLFQQALRALEKSDAPNTLEKESRSLKQGAITDLVELVRSAVRDGLRPDCFDIFYRPKAH